MAETNVCVIQSSMLLTVGLAQPLSRTARPDSDHESQYVSACGLLVLKDLWNLKSCQGKYPSQTAEMPLTRWLRCSIFRTLFHIIKHFLDPVTRQKLIFLDDTDDEKMKQKLTSYIAAEHLTAALSCRNANAPFDIDKYESRMADMQQRKPIANGRTGEDLFNRGQM